MATIFVSVTSRLIFTNFTSGQRPSNIKLGFANNTLTLTNTIVANSPIVAKASSAFNITQSLNRSKISNLTASNYLAFIQSAAKPIYISVYQNLQLTHKAARMKQGIVSHTLSLTHTLRNSRGLNNKLNLSQTASYQLITTQVVTHTLTLSSFASAYIPNNPNLILTTVPPIVLTPVSLTDSIETIVLPAPEFGNTDNVEHLRISRKTLGGDIKIFRASFWPKTERIVMDFRRIRVAIKDKLLNFLYRNRGKDITLVDYENKSWTVTVIKPDAEVSENYMRDGCDPLTYDISLEFEGVRI